MEVTSSELKKVKVIGKIDILNEIGEPTGQTLEIGSIQEVPTELADSWVANNTGEIVAE